MRVLDLRCAHGHGFEGWFASDADFVQQNSGGQVQCPLCGDDAIVRMPSAPRLNLSGAHEPPPGLPSTLPTSATGPVTASDAPVPSDIQAGWLRAVRELMARTEDVGSQFAEEARRIHYGEVEQRGIRGQATAEERAALLDEGIETVAIPVPAALKGSLQ